MESMLNVSVALICLLAVVFAECLAAIAAPVLQVVGVWIWVDAVRTRDYSLCSSWCTHEH